MACETWSEKLDLYLDGELSQSDAPALSAHLRTCGDCASRVLEKLQLKRSIATAGKQYEASPEFRKKITNSIGKESRSPQAGWLWKLLVVPAVLVVILSLGVQFFVRRENALRMLVYSELADLHVAALASANPVDVISSDRHTVKPWFQGKIPFSFNLPELQGTDFTLVGGRLAYLGQTPGAQLIYQLRKHEISVFIFQDRGGEAAALPSGTTRALSFTEENWIENGLHYFVIGDVGGADIEALSKLLRGAG